MSELPIIRPRTALEQFRRNLTIEHQISMIQIDPCDFEYGSAIIADHEEYETARLTVLYLLGCLCGILP